MMTNDKTRFTLRIPADMNDAIENLSSKWRATKSATLIRILNEYFEEKESKEKSE